MNWTNRSIHFCDDRMNINQICRSTSQYRNYDTFLNESLYCSNRMERYRLQFLIRKIQHARSRLKQRDVMTATFLIIDDT
ncbi:hypothetical protein [Bacillus taeanensis]|uniref:hypothetical protein n=1 Tax=Bacillus taeanensis TaxID=273032 RepID=UPI00115C34B1|nr:hypothetical protein [Bacillus taeanensis]